jgi:hypothetical protein
VIKELDSAFYNGEGCGGSCSACPEGPEFCSDYETKETCDNYDQAVADNSADSPAICEWLTEESKCIGTTLVSVNGIEIGRCQKEELPRTESCDDNDFIGISWNETFVWGDSNEYNTRDDCNVSSQDLGDYQTAECSWDGVSCNEVITTTTADGFETGYCTKNENPRSSSCETSSLLNVSWTASWNWSSENNYVSNESEVEGFYFIYDDSAGVYRLTDGSHTSCQSGSQIVPCPAQVKLSFFNWKNLVIAIIIIGLIYLSILEFRKNRNKVVKVEEEAKEKRKEDYEKSKKKSTKKKNSKKKKSVGKTYSKKK